MCRAFSPFACFVFGGLLIPQQTLIRLHLPGSANAASTTHPVQLQCPPPHTHTYRHTLTLPSTVAQVVAVTVIKAPHYLVMPDQKYKVKLPREEAFS